MTVIDEIAAERKRQIEQEGFNAYHDDTEHPPGELARAAACYALAESGSEEAVDAEDILDLWPWDWSWWKPKDARRNLIRAAALIVAEIERLDRAAKSEAAA